MTDDRILFVDDDPNILAGYKRSLYKTFKIATAMDGAGGLSLIEKEGPFAVIVADMQMPGMNGVEFLCKAQDHTPDSVRLMLTGNADQKTAVDAVNEGRVFSFLSKPCSVESLEGALKNALKQYRLVRAEKEVIEQTLNGAIKVLTEVLSICDPHSFGKAQRLHEEMKLVARWFGAVRPWELKLAAMLSQIGYVAVPAPLLQKLRSGALLTAAESYIIKRTPETAASLLERIPRLGTVAEIIRYQSKNFAGSGFPDDGVSGDAIPIGSRILRVLSDLLEAEKHQSRPQAFAKLRLTHGIYDPKVLEAIAACYDVYLYKPTPSATPYSVQLKDLTPGTLLTNDVYTRDGTLLVTADTHVTLPLIQKLKNFHQMLGIQEPLRVSDLTYKKTVGSAEQGKSFAGS